MARDDAKERWVIRKKLASGSTAHVYEAVDQQTGTACAVKSFFMSVPLADIEAEATLQQRVQHPNVVGVLAQEPTRLVMELVPVTLHDILETTEILPWCVIRQWLRDLLAGVQQAHALGVVHCDIKPENLMITDSGRLKIGDWGGARQVEGLKSVGTLTWCTSAPELLLGDGTVTRALDIWSVGCIAALLLRGTYLFDGTTPWIVLRNVCRIRGRPAWPEAETLPRYRSVPEDSAVSPWPEVLPNATELFTQLLEGLLCMDPRARLSAEQAQQHAFFQEGST